MLVTGSRGFIGSWLVETLEKEGHLIKTLNRSETDIATEEGRRRLSELEFDHVFHLAASGTIVESWDKIPEYISSIVVGTSHVLDRCKELKASFTYVSSYMYGAPQYDPIDEQHPVSSVNPYALAKKLSEDVCEFYATQFDLKVSVIRPFGLYGPRQKRDFLVPTILFQAIESKEIWVNDLMPAKRDFLYIKDFIDLLICTINSKENYAVFNAAQGESHTIEEVADIVQQVLGTAKPLMSKNQKRRNEYSHLFASIGKANKELGWKPKYNLHSAIADYLIEEGIKRD